MHFETEGTSFQCGAGLDVKQVCGGGEKWVRLLPCNGYNPMQCEQAACETYKAPLKPCPWCGSAGEGPEGDLVMDVMFGFNVVICHKCMCTGPPQETADGAREAWNARK